MKITRCAQWISPQCVSIQDCESEDGRLNPRQTQPFNQGILTKTFCQSPDKAFPRSLQWAWELNFLTTWYISMSIKWLTHVKNGGVLQLEIGIWKERLETAKWHQSYKSKNEKVKYSTCLCDINSFQCFTLSQSKFWFEIML